MMLALKHVTRRMSLGLCSLVLLVLLVACGGPSTPSTIGTLPTPTPKPPTPTTAPTTAPTVAMTTYKGTTFSISYPATVQESSQGSTVTFIDLVSKNIMTIVAIPNPNGTTSASAIADQSMPVFGKTLLKNSQTATVASTVTVGGETWAQRSATGELALTDPGVQGTLVLLVDNHPAGSASTMTYEITYYGPTSTFSQANLLAFQPMLQSFKFTA